MRAFVAASRTHTNRHGCLLAPLGAVCAQRTSHSIVDCGTGVSANMRTLRRRRSASWNAASASSGGSAGT